MKKSWWVRGFCAMSMPDEVSNDFLHLEEYTHTHAHTHTHTHTRTDTHTHTHPHTHTHTHTRTTNQPDNDTKGDVEMSTLVGLREQFQSANVWLSARWVDILHGVKTPLTPTR